MTSPPPAVTISATLFVDVSNLVGPPAGPVSCVVIETIEAETTTIYAGNACSVVIRNSLIGSRSYGIQVVGIGVLTIENSIVVGEDAWLRSTGKVVVRASNSRFHGGQITTGAAVYQDGGGNVFD